jgi:hypothetical protein
MINILFQFIIIPITNIEYRVSMDEISKTIITESRYDDNYLDILFTTVKE